MTVQIDIPNLFDAGLPTSLPVEFDIPPIAQRDGAIAP